jgi:hypothetical protein
MGEDSGPMKANAAAIPNGAGAAAILSAGIGAGALGVVAVAADKIAEISSLLKFYAPTGPLSGVTTVAIVVWLAAWLVLDMRWRRRDVALSRINVAAFMLLALGLLLTFPPVGDLF